MRDTNDMYVGNNCQLRIHMGGFVFSLEELFQHAVSTLSAEALEKHKEHK